MRYVISRITADPAGLHFTLANAPAAGTALDLCGLTPALGAADLLVKHTVTFSGGTVTLPYAGEAREELYLRWIVCDRGDALPAAPADVGGSGKLYVEKTDFGDGAYPYPEVDTKKGLQIVDIADGIELGAKHTAQNFILGSFVMPEPEEGNTLPYDFCGRTYYFRKSEVERQDGRIRALTDAGMIVTVILLNCRVRSNPAFWDVIRHPHFHEDGNISAFNMTSPEAVGYYMAWIAFLSERYTRPDRKYGRVTGFIVGNEVDSGYIWYNAGETEETRFAYEYTAALRLTWQIGCRYWPHMRTYVSLDHFWSGPMDASQPLRFYPSRIILRDINENCKTEGQVYWNIAHHPYPENLEHPDFWNDVTATDSPDTLRITFKNLPVLARFLYDEDYLYFGVRRRIILSEQGFSSSWTPESEVLQAAAYGRAYRVIMGIPEIDSFILHAHNDSRDEDPLNLGLRRRWRDKPGIEGKKPIWYVFKAIDQKDESGKYHWERY